MIFRPDWTEFRHAMEKIWALQDAKNRFSELVDRALSDGPQTVTRHGRKTVIIISADEYGRMTTPQGSFCEFMRKSPLAGAQLDIDRPRDTGRKLKL